MIENTNKITKEIISKRYEIFNNAKLKLKKDFYGIDDVIDEIFKAIETWYIYPEFMTRPCVINLWGLTGVGKTDLVKKLKTYLQIDKFASTEMDNTTNTIEDLTTESTYYSNSKTKGIFDLLNQFEITPNDKSILLLDEIHRYATIDKDGKPLHRNRFNDIWKLLSDGSLYDSSLGIYQINSAIEDIEAKYDSIRLASSKNADTLDNKIMYMLGNVNVDDKDIKKEKKMKDDMLKENGYIPWDFKRECQTATDYANFSKGNSNVVNLQNLLYVVNIDDEDMRQIKMLRYIYQGADDAIVGEILLRTSENNVDKFDSYYKYFSSCSNKVVLEWLKYKKRKLIEASEKLNETEMRAENLKYVYSKMLIFICGNVKKEAYNKESKFEIRDYMKTLFRDEQMARFGNNYIVYPVLTKEVYDTIIDNEITFTEKRLQKEYENDTLKFDHEKIHNLVLEDLPKDYVYNGVRPIYSAVQRILSEFIPPMLIKLVN